jgi:hypothetical protein
MGQLVKAFEMRHWVILFVWNSRHSPPGKWDITALRPPRWIECEAKTGKADLTDAQRRYGDLLARYPWIEARVVRDTAEDWRAFVEWIT